MRATIKGLSSNGEKSVTGFLLGSATEVKKDGSAWGARKGLPKGEV